MRELIRFLIIGFVAGWIAGLVVRGSGRPRGCISNIVVGLIGAVIGGYLLDQLDITGAGSVWSVLSATLGAVVLLVILRMVRNG